MARRRQHHPQRLIDPAHDGDLCQHRGHHNDRQLDKAGQHQPVEAVGEGAAEGQQKEQRDRFGHRYDPQPGAGMGQLPGQHLQPDTVKPEPRRRRPAGQLDHREIAVAKRAQRALGHERIADGSEH